MDRQFCSCFRQAPGTPVFLIFFPSAPCRNFLSSRRLTYPRPSSGSSTARPSLPTLSCSASSAALGHPLIGCGCSQLANRPLRFRPSPGVQASSHPAVALLCTPGSTCASLVFPLAWAHSRRPGCSHLRPLSSAPCSWRSEPVLFFFDPIFPSLICG